MSCSRYVHRVQGSQKEKGGKEMSKAEEIQRNILLKWEFIHMARKEIFELEAKREALLVQELREKVTEKAE